MVETNFYYFGSIIPISNVSGKMFRQRNLRQDIYCYINDFGLDYRRVGNVQVIFRIILGRELAVFKETNPYSLTNSHLYQRLDEVDVKKYRLSKREEKQIQQTLYNSGCFVKPEYWCIHNYYYTEEEREYIHKKHVKYNPEHIRNHE